MLTDNDFDKLMRQKAGAAGVPQVSGISVAVIERINSQKIIPLPALSKAAWYTGIAAAAMLFIAVGVEYMSQKSTVINDPSAAVYADLDDSLELSWNSL